MTVLAANFVKFACLVILKMLSNMERRRAEFIKALYFILSNRRIDTTCWTGTTA